MSQYLDGSFSAVRVAAEELEKLGYAVDLVIHTQGGPIRGDAPATELPDTSAEDATVRTRQDLLRGADGSDAVFVSLRQENFTEIVGQIWPDLVSAPTAGAVWCLACAGSCLDQIGLEALQKVGAKALTYERRGVARIDQETRDEFLDLASRKANNRGEGEGD